MLQNNIAFKINKNIQTLSNNIEMNNNPIISASSNSIEFKVDTLKLKLELNRLIDHIRSQIQELCVIE